ncbi:MAG: ParB/RepB/Spo0J family partition protein [Novosphingobium sp.]|nr:ParB/RepB/Spo0J family partition protein [Novosphingobium sp.]
MKIVEVNVAALDVRYGALRVRDRRREAQLMTSLEEHGQQDAISVIEDGAGRWVVVDGHKRVRALKRLRRDVAKAVVLEMPAAEALAAAYRFGSGPSYNAIEEGWLVHELHRVGKWDLGKTAVSIGRSKSWVSGRLGLVEILPEAVLEGVRSGKIGAYTATRHLLPFARANAGDCESLAVKVIENGFRSREVETLCRYYAAAGLEGKRRMLEDPARFLKALEAAKHRDGGNMSSEEARCLKNLELIGNVSLGLARSLPTALAGETATAARERLRPAWERARRRWTELVKTASVVLDSDAEAKMANKETAHA